jgi:hypothetical protein
LFMEGFAIEFDFPWCSNKTAEAYDIGNLEAGFDTLKEQIFYFSGVLMDVWAVAAGIRNVEMEVWLANYSFDAAGNLASFIVRNRTVARDIDIFEVLIDKDDILIKFMIDKLNIVNMTIFQKISAAISNNLVINAEHNIVIIPFVRKR